MKIRFLALDLGMVVLFFSHQLACCRLSRLGGGRIPASELYRRLFDSGLNAAMDLGMPLDEIVLRLGEVCEVQSSPDELVRAFSDIFWVNSDVCDVLPLVPREITVLIASNTNAAHASLFQREFAHILRFCDDQVLSCQLDASKPSAAFYAGLIARTGGKPDEILFFDDRQDNLAGAAAAGLVTVPYTPNTLFAAELAKHGIVLSPQPVRG